MIGAFVAIISLNLTASLVGDYGVVYKTLPITDASVSTPIVVTSAAHGVALGSRIHGIVSGVLGTVEANGLWVLTPQDADTFSLTTFDSQGNPINSEGVNAYISGGTIQWALPDGQILLGRRNKTLATQVATPRVVMIPTRGRAWDFEPYGGAAPNITGLPFSPTARGTQEQQAEALAPQMVTEFLTFEVYINGSGPNYGKPLNPDFEDFDATQAVVHAFYAQLFDATGGRAKVIQETWPSQVESQGAMTQRGQQWCGLLEVQMPVSGVPGRYVPIGTTCEMIVQPTNPLVPDDLTTIDFG